MEKAYWLERKRASLKAARNAAGAEARLAHYELAGRYSLNAAAAEAMPTTSGAIADHDRAELPIATTVSSANKSGDGDGGTIRAAVRYGPMEEIKRKARRAETADQRGERLEQAQERLKASETAAEADVDAMIKRSIALHGA